MSGKTISVTVDFEIYEKYVRFCKKNNMDISKQFEKFMIKELIEPDKSLSE